MWKTNFRGAVLMASALGLAGCNDPVNGYFASIPNAASSSSPDSSGTLSSPVPSPSSSSPVVCNPFGGASSGSSDSGVVASLNYIPSSTYTFDDTNLNDCSYNAPQNCPYGLDIHVADFQQFGVPVPATIILSAVDVVPEYFTLGFPGPNGALVDNSGAPLTAYFSLDIKGRIQLAPTDLPGDYQFATISDDGSILSIDAGDGLGLREIVNNDYWHGAMLGCATQTIHMDSSSQLPMEVNYFQGSPKGIAMMMLYKPISSGESLNDPYCFADAVSMNATTHMASSYTHCSGAGCANTGGPGFYNVTNTSSTPTEVFTDMLSHGWKVMSADNFLQPLNAAPNPCVSPSPSPSSQ